MSYATQLAAADRTPQQLVVVRVPQCSNHYASGIITNEILYTAALDNAAWTKSGGCTVTPDTVANPAVTTTIDADAVAFAAAADYIESSSSATNAQSTTFNASVWVRAAAAGTITIRITNTVAAVQVYSSVVSVGTTWQRVSVTGTFTAAANGKARMQLYRTAGDLAAVYAWGAQLTVGADLYDHALNSIIAVQRPSICQAVDAGDGSRCYYTFGTCQDVAHYYASPAGWMPDGGLKKMTFCRKSAPLAIAGENVYPLLESAQYAAQKIDVEKAVTQSERVHLKFSDTTQGWNWNQDKAGDGAKTNTTAPSGTFWRRFLRLHRNYANPLASATMLTGFVESGATEASYEQRGKYMIKNLSLSNGDMMDMECTDRLKLLKLKAPAKISETNLINGAINSAVTTLVVDDGSQVTVPGTGYNVCLELSHTGTNEFVNVTAISGNTLTIQRGRWGTAAASHADNAVFREVLQYGTENPTPASAPLGKSPIDIAIEMLYRAGLAAAEIDSATLTDERDTWMVGSVSGTTETGVLFERCGENVGYGNGAVLEQAEMEAFLKQIREVCMLDLWVNESQVVTGRLFAPARPAVTLEDLTETSDILAGSLMVDDNEESRYSRVIIAYDLQSGKKGDALGDYGRFLVRVDADAEATGSYGEARTKIILSPWIKGSDSSTASKLAAHILMRFREPVREIEFSLELRRDAVKCGDFAHLTTQKIVTPSGATDSQRVMQIVRKVREEIRGRLNYTSVDTGLSVRYGFIAPAGYPDYDGATAAQRRYAFIGTATTNRVGTAADPGYFIW